MADGAVRIVLIIVMAIVNCMGSLYRMPQEQSVIIIISFLCLLVLEVNPINFCNYENKDVYKPICSFDCILRLPIL